MTPPDPTQVVTIIEAVARDIILPRFRTLADGHVREKEPGDLVTIADEESEARLSEELAALLPGSVVVGEEAVAADPSVLDRLSGDAPVWIVDPLDGTANFASGNERFAMIVALAHGGRTVAGWIHEPLSGRTGWAVTGEGTFVDGERTRVAAPAAIADMRGFVSGPKYSRDWWPRLSRLRDSMAAGRNLRCSGIEYLELASGRAHLCVPVRLKPWDHAAGVLMHREAGGFSAFADGSDYTPMVHEGLLIVAPNAENWHTVRDMICADLEAETG